MLDTGRLDRITTFPALIDYLREELDWPIEDFKFDDLTYDWHPSEFGLSTEAAGQIEIKQLRPIEREPWGIFFLSLPHKKLPITVLRRILGGLAIKKRASSNAAEQAAWDKDDLLFIAAHGAGDERSLAFAHFHEDKEHGDLPSLKVLGWDEADTIRRLSDTHRTLKEKLHWRKRGEDDVHWRSRWNEAFREKPGESIATSKALAKELARLAREIRRRANELLLEESEKGPLRTLHKAFKEVLIHDLKFDDFADMYAQTIAYGLLAARISRESGALVSDNAADLAPPTNPFLKELLQTFLSAGGRKGGMDFDELGVNDVVEMLRRADMHAVLLDFDTKNPSEDPVIHFYELFLKEYDAKKRMQRGVFYTPRPVVSFIVRSVDEVLRTEFGLEDGLASTATWGEVIASKPGIKLPIGAKDDEPFVRILDPATGTGTFLVEVVDLIHGRMAEKWRTAGKSAKEIDALWNDYVPKHLLPRLYGFELMMAPYAIAHMKLGLKLAETNYQFRSEKRARIYLTNALEPAQDFDMQLRFMSEALAHEAQAANKAKDVRFTVVIGNPPYSLVSSNLSPAQRALVEAYKFVGDERIRERGALQLEKILNDDYVKFIRISELATTRTGVGVIGLITNHSFLDNPTQRGLRHSLLQSYGNLRFVDLGGSAKKASGDENVFDIQQGVCISVMSRNGAPEGARGVRFGRIIGDRTKKYELLLRETSAITATEDVNPVSALYQFLPRDSDAPEWASYTSLPEAMPLKSIGFFSSKDSLVIGPDKEKIAQQVEAFAASKLPNKELCESFGIGMKEAWNVTKSRDQLRAIESVRDKIVSFLHRPFDEQSVFYDRSLIWSMSLPVNKNMIGGDNLALVSSRQLAFLPWQHVFCSNTIVELCYTTGRTKEGNHVFPLWIEPDGTASAREANFSKSFLARFDQVAQTALKPREVFDWIYAVLHSPAYRSRYADYLKSDFARIPLPGSKELFQELVPLGTQLVVLHLLDVDGAPELKDPHSVRFAGHGEARVEHAPSWSAAGGNRVTISNHRWFEGVPERVWNLHIGGYQPAQKWLKDRAAKGGKKATPGRILTAEDQLHYRRMIVAMDKTIDLMAEIDRVIDKHGGWPAAFKGMHEGAEPEAAE